MLRGFTIRYAFSLGLLFRVILLAWAAWQDSALPIRYTDVDYDVFTGAADLVARGLSPYAQPGYRYPPLIAWMLVPGALLGIPWLWGRALFCFGDLLCFLSLENQLVSEGANSPRAYAALFWLSPFAAVLSTRGSMDALSCFLILLVLYPARSYVAGLWLGVAVYLRLYPVIFVLPVLNWFLFGAGGPRPKIASGFGLAPGLSFLVGVGASFSLLAGPSLWCHGWDAVSQAYLYHGSRVDAAHSFSPLWFHIHSSIAAGGNGGWAVAAPWSLLAALALGALLWRDLPLCFFLQTLAFVSLNRVITAQYFNWWAVFLPLLAPRCTLSFRATAALGGAWVAAYLHWLAWAYQLEHLQRPVHRELGAAAWFFFAANAAVGFAAWRYRRNVSGEVRGKRA
jgi:phosphatidylinositol glycan class M